MYFWTIGPLFSSYIVFEGSSIEITLETYNVAYYILKVITRQKTWAGDIFIFIDYKTMVIYQFAVTVFQI